MAGGESLSCVRAAHVLICFACFSQDAKVLVEEHKPVKRRASVVPEEPPTIGGHD